MLFFSCACIALARKSAFCSFVLHSIPCPASCVLHHIWSSPHPARVILHCVHRFPFMQLLCTTHVRIDTLIIAFHLPPSRVRAFVLVPLQLVPSGSIPAGPFQRMISLASFASPHLATIVALFIALRSTSRACVRLSCPRCGSFLPVPHPSRPFQTLSCFLHSALSCFVSFILLLASHLVSIFAFFIGFPSCSRSVPRTHTRIYTKICSLKQWLFSM